MGFSVSEWKFGRRNDDDLLSDIYSGPAQRLAVCDRAERSLANGLLLDADRHFTWLLHACEDLSEQIRARALAGAGHIARMRDQSTQAQAQLSEACELALKHNLHSVVVRAGYDLGILALAKKDRERAREWFRLSIQSSSEVQGCLEHGQAMLEMARLSADDGNWPEVELIADEAEQVLRRARDHEGHIQAVLFRAQACLLEMRFKLARKLASRAIKLARKHKAWRLAAEVALLAGEASERLNRWREARARYVWAKDTACKANWENPRARSLLGLGRIEFEHVKSYDSAYELLREAAALFTRTQDKVRLKETLGYLVQISHRLGRLEQGRDFEQWRASVDDKVTDLRTVRQTRQRSLRVVSR